jgi:small subunit ribosomal protein S17
MDMTRAAKARKMIGIVVKDKMDKTVVVEVEKTTRHSKYHKYLKVKRTWKAHDEENKARVGDTVLLVETRPLSKEKRWLVQEIIKKEALAGVEEAVEQ